jgi:hypothetical protein
VTTTWRALFGAVAFDSTAFRIVDRNASEPVLLDALRGARTRGRASGAASCVARLSG